MGHVRRTRMLWTMLVVALGVVAAIGKPSDAEAQKPLRKVVMVFASTNFPVGTSPVTTLPRTLGYWQEEGLDVELQGAAGSLPSLQMVLGGKGDVGVVQPITLFQMRPKGARVKAFYAFIRHNWFFPAVLEGSPIKTVKDFKGKKIGVQSMGASMIPFMKLVPAEAGLDPERDATFVAKDEWLRGNPEVAVGLGRGLAKATLFSLHNPEAAVRLHWQAMPQTRPAGEDEAVSMKKALHDLNAGLTFMRIDTAGVQKWGMTTREEVEAYGNVLVRAGLLEGRPGGPEEYYTGEFVERINAFDQQKIIEQARSLPR